MNEDKREDSSLGQENHSRGYIYLTVFVAGMTTLAVEFTTSRMLQTVYGTSNIVWANVIGLVLLFLTLGYFLGGRLADRYPRSNIFYWLVTIAGISSVVSLLVASLILRSAASALASVNAGAVISSLVGVIFTLALPITLLGCVSPFAIRLAMRDINEAGRLSGRVYAISTMGSLLGTYLPVLLVIPLAGSRITAIVFGSALFIVGIIGLWRTKSQGRLAALFLGLLIVPLAFFLNKGNLKDDPNQIFETESAYNYIQVVRQGECNYLLLNEGQAYHSFYCEDGHVPQISVWSIMLAAPFFEEDADIAPVRNMAVIGLAAGTIPKQFTQVFGPIAIDGIELDPAIVQAGRDYFALDEPNIKVIVGDGRYELNQLEDRYDVITLDAYKVPYIPWHLTTREFFSEVKDRLTERGVLAINVGRVPNDRRLVEAVTATLLEEFTTVHTIDVPGSLNTILVATVRPTDSQALLSNLTSLEADAAPLLGRALQTAAGNLVETKGSEVIFTDERAPVETMIDSIVIRYLLEEGPGALPGLGS